MAPTRLPLTEIDPNTRRAQAHQRPGPKPKDFLHRVHKPAPPIKAPRRSYPKRKKLEVIQWILNERIYDPRRDDYDSKAPRLMKGLEWEGSYRPPTSREAEAHFKIDESNIKRWWLIRDEILQQRGGTRRDCTNVRKELWPQLELKLFEDFWEKRKQSGKVSRGWFRRRALRLANELYKDCNFSFSHAWFKGFCRRYDISHRRLTHEAQKTPKEYQESVNSFLQFIRRNSIHPSLLATAPDDFHYLPRDCMRFLPSNILNMDEVPIPFEFLDGYTYHLVGEKTVSGKSDRSGWGKRQATLILYIFADGVARIKPKLIFHGKPTGKIREKEQHLWDQRVTVEFNDTAYNNGELFVKWIDDELIPALGQRESLLVMDHASFHKTDEGLDKMRNHTITPAMIPPGCTSILQPLDVAVNKPFKGYLRDLIEEVLDEMEAKDEDTRTASARRIITTKIVAEAWERLISTERGKKLIQDSFIHTGINIHPDGSNDTNIRIKDHPDISFEGWRTRDKIFIKEEMGDDEEQDFYNINEEERYMWWLKACKVPQLRDLCTEKGLLRSGSKDQLIKKLLQHHLTKVATGDSPEKPEIIDEVVNT